MQTKRSKLIIGLLVSLFTLTSICAGEFDNCNSIQESTIASCSTSHTASVVTWSYNDNGNTINYSVVLVDGANLAPTDHEILIPPGIYDVARFRNIKRDASCPITIRADGGQVEFKGETKSTFVLENCKFVTVDGTVNGQPYNILIKGAPYGQQGVTVYGDCSNIEIHDLKVFNPLGFAGIMVKNSPYCHPVNGITGYCGEQNAAGEEIYIHDVYIHHNYIENTRGEGIYVGDTKFLTAFPCNGINYYRQKMENVEIAYNTVINTRLDAIQLGSCTYNGSIHNNIIREYGLDNEGGQANGIQIGVGTQGAVCHNNFIHKSAPISAGHGIFCQGAGDNCIYNNIIYQTAENGVYVNESTLYRPQTFAGGCVKLNKYKSPSKIQHNTIVYPGSGPSPSTNSQSGIRLAFTTGAGGPLELITNIFGHSLEKNLIVASDAMTTAERIDMTPPLLPALEGCVENVLKSNVTNLSSVFTYGGGMPSGSWFVPLASQTDIVDAALNAYCLDDCGILNDYFGNNRTIGPRPDFGAIECSIKGSKPCYNKTAKNEIGLISAYESQLGFSPYISPNPFKAEFHLNFKPRNSGDYFIQVFTINGQELYAKRVYFENDMPVVFNLSNAIRKNTKIYLVRLLEPDGTMHSMRVIQID